MFVTQKQRCSISDQKRRQRIMCYKYRSGLCILLAAIVVFTAIFPVRADDPVVISYDMLTASSYQCRYGDKYVTGLETPVLYSSGNTSVTWTWHVNADYNFSHVNFWILAKKAPSKITVQFYSTGVTRVAEYIGSHGAYHQYTVQCSSNVYNIALTGFWDEPYTGSFNLMSFIGYREYGYSVRFNWEYQMFSADSGGGGTDWSLINSKNDVRAPSGDFHSSSSELWLQDKVTIYVTEEQRAANSLNAMMFIIESCDPVSPYLCLVDSSTGSVKEVIPEEAYACIVSTTYISGDYEWSYYSSQITVDLSDYDLSGRDLELTFVLDPTSGRDGKFTNFYVEECRCIPLVTEAPWYKRFWNWLSMRLGSLNDSVISAINNVTSTIKNIFDGGAAGDALSDAGEAMSDQADSMNQAQAQLDSVERPSLDSNTLFGDILNFDTGGLQVLSCITSNQYVTSLMVVVFTFALCSYVFFGKKG